MGFTPPRSKAEQKRVRELLAKQMQAGWTVGVTVHGLHPRFLSLGRVGSATRREFGKSVDWLLTGKTHIESKKRAPKDPVGFE
jgi:hypothetical protein